MTLVASEQRAGCVARASSELRRSQKKELMMCVVNKKVKVVKPSSILISYIRILSTIPILIYLKKRRAEHYGTTKSIVACVDKRIDRSVLGDDIVFGVQIWLAVSWGRFRCSSLLCWSRTGRELCLVGLFSRAFQCGDRAYPVSNSCCASFFVYPNGRWVACCSFDSMCKLATSTDGVDMGAWRHCQVWLFLYWYNHSWTFLGEKHSFYSR